MKAQHIDGLSTHLQLLLATFAPVARARILKQIALEARRENTANMRAQQSAEGQKWQPRQRGSGKIRQARQKQRKMMVGLAKTQHLKIYTNDKSATLSHGGTYANLAAIHHYGLTQRGVHYPSRPLLGITASTEAAAQQIITNALLKSSKQK